MNSIRPKHVVFLHVNSELQCAETYFIGIVYIYLEVLGHHDECIMNISESQYNDKNPTNPKNI